HGFRDLRPRRAHRVSLSRVIPASPIYARTTTGRSATSEPAFDNGRPTLYSHTKQPTLARTDAGPPAKCTRRHAPIFPHRLTRDTHTDSRSPASCSLHDSPSAIALSATAIVTSKKENLHESTNREQIHATWNDHRIDYFDHLHCLDAAFSAVRQLMSAVLAADRAESAEESRLRCRRPLRHLYLVGAGELRLSFQSTEFSRRRLDHTQQQLG